MSFGGGETNFGFHITLLRFPILVEIQSGCTSFEAGRTTRNIVKCYATSFEAGRVLCHLFWPLIVLLLSREAQKGRKRPIMAGPISISISGIILTNFIGGAFLFGFYLLDYRLGPILDVA